MGILKIALIVLEVVILFNLLIFVHELGHFLAARWRGLKVERFAIWFGKPIWSKNIGGVEYALGWIPAGGYVSLPQMAPMELLEGKTQDAVVLPPVTAIDKIIVAFAGPLFSLFLAFAFAVVVWVVGRPIGESEMTTVIGYVEKGGPAEMVGLKPGDKILTVDGHAVSKFMGMGDSVVWHIVSSEGESIEMKVSRDGKEMVFNPKPVIDPTKAWQRKNLRQIKIAPAQTPNIGEIAENSPAAIAGLRVGDIIKSINGEPVYHFGSLSKYVEASPDAVLKIAYSRNGIENVVNVKPVIPISPSDQKPRVGITWSGDAKHVLVRPDPFEQVWASLRAMYDTFGALFSSKSDVKPQHLGGAVKILSIYYLLFQDADGWRLALWFSVVMNVNLALLNLLPFPVLDGGHIVLSIAEWIRRKPVSAWLLNGVQTTCAVVLIGYMAYIAFYDVQDLAPKNESETAPLRFAPQPMEK